MKPIRTSLNNEVWRKRRSEVSRESDDGGSMELKNKRGWGFNIVGGGGCNTVCLICELRKVAREKRW